MLVQLRERVTMLLAYVEIRDNPETEMERPEQEMHEGRVDPAFEQPQAEQGEGRLTSNPVLARKGADERDPNNPETWGRVGRNEPCPCGSGKKFKQCHGRL